MKTLATLVFFIASFALVNAQALSGPESVTWDQATNRYFVSNNGANQILVRSTSGVYTIFTSAITSGPHGLEIVGNTLYACDGAYIKGFDLTTAAQVFSVNTGGSFLNGLCTDGTNNLFSSDFTAKKIFRINIAQQTFTTFVTGLVKSPNGIYYDQSGGRLIWVTWGTNAPIMQALLSDSTVSQVTATTLGNCDGLVRDGLGNYYVSAWNSSSIVRFTNSFASPTAVVTGLNSPADIYYNLVTDTLASPNSGSNTVTFHYFGVTGTQETSFIPSSVSVYPVPVKLKAFVEFQLTNGAVVSISVLDITGKEVLRANEKYFNAGKNKCAIETSALPAGIYLVELSSSAFRLTKKIVVAAE